MVMARRIEKASWFGPNHRGSRPGNRRPGIQIQRQGLVCCKQEAGLLFVAKSSATRREEDQEDRHRRDENVQTVR